MKRLVLFSTPTTENRERVLDSLLPNSITSKVLGYLASDGANSPAEYVNLWRGWAETSGWQLIEINNSLTGEAAVAERSKLDKCGSLLITGGNTFTLLHHLRASGLDQSIKDFAKGDNFVLGGFSAGAIVLTPTIKLAGEIGDYDENAVGLTDLTGLNIVDYEVLPHYEDRYAAELDHYRQSTPNEVKTITDEELIVIDK